MDRIKRSEWRKIVMITLVAANVGVLFFLKYGNWLRVVINREAVLWKLLIPIGISFYTLEQICFIVDTYKSGSMKYSCGKRQSPDNGAECAGIHPTDLF